MTKPSLLDKIETFLGAAGAAKKKKGGRDLKHILYHISLQFMCHKFGKYTCMKLFLHQSFLSHYFFIIIKFAIVSKETIE